MSTNTHVDIHVVQPLPPNCLNRGLDGSPKSSIFGGVPRVRISSQSWKRAMRLFMENDSVRTRAYVNWITDYVVDKGLSTAPREEVTKKAAEMGRFLFVSDKPDAKAKTDDKPDAKAKESKAVMSLFSKTQLAAVASAVAEALARETKLEKAGPLVIQAREALKENSTPDIMLWGRMFAADHSLDVDASFQVAHALGVSEMNFEFDDLTAFDDYENQAGHLTTAEFTSDPVYRYGSINFDQLVAGYKGDVELARQVVLSAVEAFILSLPTGKTNVFAPLTVPGYVQLSIGGRPLSLAGAFEDPVRPVQGKNLTDVAATRLEDYQTKLIGLYGNRIAPELQLVLGGEGAANIDAMLTSLRGALG